MAAIRNYTHPPFTAKSQLPKLFLSRSCNTGLRFYLYKKQDTNVYVNCMNGGLWNLKWKCSAYLAANEVILLKTTYQFYTNQSQQVHNKKHDQSVHKEGFATVSDFNYIVSGLTVCLYSYDELCVATFELKMAKKHGSRFPYVALEI